MFTPYTTAKKIRYCTALTLVLLSFTGCAHVGKGKGPSEAYPVSAQQQVVPFAPESPTDKALLDSVEGMEAGDRQAFGSEYVSTGLSYNAASGLVCKPVTVSRVSGTVIRRQLTCSVDGAWRFVKNVVSFDGVEMPSQ